MIQNFVRILQNPRPQIRLLPASPRTPDAAAGTFAALAAASMAAVPRLPGQHVVQGSAGAGSPAPATRDTTGGLVATDYAQYLGRATGSGQCVALIQAANPGIGPTRNWRCGPPVRGNTGLPPGTAIATFNGADRYANATDGSSHAAIYLGQNERGIQVMDQWSGSAAAVRTIPWSNPDGRAADTATAFHVVRPT